MKKGNIVFLCVLYFLFAISVNLVHPITVTYVTSLQLDDSFFGFFVSLMSLGQVVGAFLFGALSDKLGRKWMIFIGFLGYALSQFGFGFINNNEIIILIFRFFAGVFVAAPSTLFVSVCLDYSNETNKVKNLTVMSSVYILGTSIGYEIGGMLYNYANFSIEQVFIFQIAFTCLVALTFAILIKDVYLPANISIEDKQKFKKINVQPIVIMLLVPLMILTMAQILINKYLDTYIIHIGYEPADLGHYVLISGLFSFVSNIAIIPLLKKLKDNKLALCLLLFVALSAGLTFITFLVKANIMVLLFTSHLLYIMVKGWITPLEQNELSIYTDKNNKGKITGYRQMVLSMGNVLGPLIGSAIYSKGSPIIFIVAAFIIVMSLLLYISYFAIKKRKM